MLKTTFLAAAALATTISAPTFAKDISVSYKDLDLQTEQGQRTLTRRIDAAARKACGLSQTLTGSRLPDSSALDCFKQARTRAHDALAATVGDANLGG